MPREEHCHHDLEVRSVEPDDKVYIGEYTEKNIVANGLYSDDNIDEECQPRPGLVFGVLDKDGNEDSSFVIRPTHKDDIRRTIFPTDFTAPEESRAAEVGDGIRRDVFIRDANYVVEGGACRLVGRHSGACSVLRAAIVFVKRN